MNIAEKKVESNSAIDNNKLQRRNSLITGIGLKDKDEFDDDSDLESNFIELCDVPIFKSASADRD